MKYHFSLFCLCLSLLLFLIVYNGGSNMNLTNKFYMKNTVVNVLVNGGGSGVIVYSDSDDEYSLILTAKHIIEATGEAEDIHVVTYPDGELHQATVVLMGEDVDLAVLRIEVEHPFVAKLAWGHKPYVFEKVWQVGGALGLRPFPTRGHVELISDDEDSMYISAEMVTGNSGGGVFVKQRWGSEYRLIGIGVAVAAMWFADHPHLVPHMGRCLNVDTIEKFFETDLFVKKDLSRDT